MKVSASSTSPPAFRGDMLALPVRQGEAPSGVAAEVNAALGGWLDEVRTAEGFAGTLEQVLVVHTHGRLPARRVALAGLGPAGRADLGALRRAAAAVARRARVGRAPAVGFVLPEGFAPEVAAQAAAEGAILGAYRYAAYRAYPSEERVDRFEVLAADRRAAARGVGLAESTAGATVLARDLVNAPANEVTPARLAGLARGWAKAAGLRATVLDRARMERLGMGSLLGVARGSAEPPQLIVLEYRPARARRTVALVGKAVTFDSGGYDIKTHEGMLPMKSDMAGGAAVLAAMRALPRLAPAVRVVGVVPAVENLISGTSYKPGDVLRAMNGRTIEVANTDAEGRLILADALAYAAGTGADELVDVATLTGSAMVALGYHAAAVMGNDEGLIDRIRAAAEAAGERVWPLPLYDEYLVEMRSPIADLRNSGGRYGGAQKGAVFLREFVGGTPWAHLDIAGPAFLDKPEGTNSVMPRGATGFGARTLLELVRRYV